MIRFLLVSVLVSAWGREVGPPAALADRDGDGSADERDACADVPGVAPDGCPFRDGDGDGVIDVLDACPAVPGFAPDDCLRDSDDDGFVDVGDRCPDASGVRVEFTILVE